MAVYRDDGSTQGDEGAIPGDTISFTIDGKPAFSKNGVVPMWTSNGDVKKINLVVEEPLIGVTPLSLDFGPVALHTIAQQSIQVANVGLKPLRIDSVQSYYHFPDCIVATPVSVVINPGENTNINIAFAPALGSGAVSGSVLLYTNAANQSVVEVPVSASIQTDVIATNEWVSFWSDSTWFDGNPVQPGDVIDVFDPQGVHCGTYTVTASGKYGLVPVYRDDATTSSVDEGASPGELLSFMINGYKATVKTPVSPTWTTNGDVAKVHLVGHTNHAPIITNAVPDIVVDEDTPPFTIADLSAVFNDPDNDVLQYSVFCNAKAITLQIENGAIVTATLAPEWSGTDTIIFTASDGLETVIDSIGITVNWVNDLPENFSLLAPAKGAVLNETATTPTFQWTRSFDKDHNGGIHYELAYAADSISSPAIVTQIVTDSFYTVPANEPLKSNTRYFWNVKAVDEDNSFVYASGSDTAAWKFDIGFVVAVSAQQRSIPVAYAMSQNFPNPFNPSTTIHFDLPNRSKVVLHIVNTLGQVIETPIDKELEGGVYLHQISASTLSSGLYFYSIDAVDVINPNNRFVQTRKMVILK